MTLHRDRFYRDGDVTWWHFSGRPMGAADWHDHGARSLGLLVGEWLLLLHAGEAGPCTLPPGGPYVPAVDSTCPDGTPASPRPLPGGAWSPSPGVAAAPAPGRPAGPVAPARRRYPRPVPRYDFRCRQCSTTFEVDRPYGRRRRPGTLPRRPH